MSGFFWMTDVYKTQYVEYLFQHHPETTFHKIILWKRIAEKISNCLSLTYTFDESTEFFRPQEEISVKIVASACVHSNSL